MKCIDSLPGDKNVIYCIAWHPKKHIIAGGFGNGSVWFWDIQKRLVLHKVNLQTVSCFKLCWNKIDPSFLAVSSKDSSLFIIKDDGKIVRTYKHPRTVFGVDWSPHDKNLVATGCHDFIIRIFDISSTVDSPQSRLKGHTAEVFNVLFHPIYPNIIISGSNDKTIRIWNIETNDCQILEGHTNFVRALSWNPEIPHIAISGSWDGTIRVWDIRNNRCLHVAKDHHADVYGISVHEQRPFIYGSTSRDTTIRFWTLEPLLKNLVIKAVLTRDLSNCLGCAENYKIGTSCSEVLLCGKSSQELNNVLKALKTEVEKYELIFNFFSFPYDSQVLWRVVADSIFGKPNEKSRIIHRKHLGSYLESKAKELESVKTKKTSGIAASKKNEKLMESGLIYLKLGKIRQYCDTMIEIGQWERALAVAPAVSIEYWRELSIRYGQVLAENGNSDCMPFYLVAQEIDKLLNFYISRQQYDDATIIAQMYVENRYSTISSSISPKDVFQTPNSQPHKTSSELKKITEMRTNEYLSVSLPILAASCYIAIDDNDRAVRTLVNGVEILHAYALSICLKSTMHNDDMLAAMVSCCEKYGLHDYSIELLQQIRDKDIVSTIVSKLVAKNEKETEKILIKVGLQSPSFYRQEAEIIEKHDLKKAVRYYALGGNYNKACFLCIEGMRGLFKADFWNWDEIKKLSSAMYCIDATRLSNPQMLEMLAYASFIGGQQALWKGYYSIAPSLFQNAKALSMEKNVSFAIPIAYIDYMLCLAYNFFDQKEAIRLINQIEISGSLSNDSFLVSALQSLKKELAKSDNIYIRQVMSNKNAVVPTASNLPLRSINGIRTRSYITKREAQPPLLLLNEYDFVDVSKKTDKKKYYVSLSEAIMWNAVNPFSPLNDGRRLQL
jgi:hypothetical protein